MQLLDLGLQLAYSLPDHVDVLSFIDRDAVLELVLDFLLASRQLVDSLLYEGLRRLFGLDVLGIADRVDLLALELVAVDGHDVSMLAKLAAQAVGSV